LQKFPVSGCANDEHSETFELWYPQDSSGRTPQLHNEPHDCVALRSPELQTATIPTGTVMLLKSQTIADTIILACQTTHRHRSILSNVSLGTN